MSVSLNDSDYFAREVSGERGAGRFPSKIMGFVVDVGRYERVFLEEIARIKGIMKLLEEKVNDYLCSNSEGIERQGIKTGKEK